MSRTTSPRTVVLRTTTPSFAQLYAGNRESTKPCLFALVAGLKRQRLRALLRGSKSYINDLRSQANRILAP